ncbi:hypothetical protein [Candidatus Pelagibacter sp. HIMB1506]|uniref:hypothetical protein n=1 Tax=Candidatus Pelagibacter sp. HIMB1506 TaxID=3413337 RepID=UPI003F847EB2
MKKIILINISVLLVLVISIFFLLKFINLFISGPPRYYELVYNLENGSLRKKKEKLIYYKSLNSKIKHENEIKFYSDEYKNLKYSGPIKNEDCGSFESGKYELIYALDNYGFRENQDELHQETDYVLLGDSFIISVCESKPYDFKSQLKMLSKDKKFLNLGVGADNYVSQLATLTEVTQNTNFNSLIWFFYEGNDYNDELNKYEYYKKTIRPNHNERKKSINQSISNDELYKVKKKFYISNFYKFRVWLAEEINGLSSLLKIFKKYEALLNNHEYEQVIKIASNYLDQKKIRERYIYYIPSWQRLSNFKSNRIGFYSTNPQIKQLDILKKNVKEISEKNGFTFIDGENRFLNLNNPLSVFHYKLNTHFNRYGYKLFAEDVYNQIINKSNNINK